MRPWRVAADLSLARRRLFALATAMVFLVGQMAGFAHLVAVQHARCPDHGELIDVAGPPAAQLIKSGIGGKPTSAGLTARDRGERGHKHEHCTVALKRRERSARAEPTHFAATAPSLVALHDHAAYELAHLALPLLRLAPKTSPPA